MADKKKSQKNHPLETMIAKFRINRAKQRCFARYTQKNPQKTLTVVFTENWLFKFYGSW